ncbi:Fc.00g001560.m01.CDS01 [Cosmosporella sp. VM-42]
MSPPIEPRRVAEIMVSWLGLDLISCTELQTLWAGYGHVCAIKAQTTVDEVAAHWSQICGQTGKGRGNARVFRLILKLISPPAPTSGGDEGHLRKMLSYDVEQYFYEEVVPLLGDDVAVATCLASTRRMEGQSNSEELRGLTAMVMTDLRPKFPVAGEKRSVLNERQVNAAVDWLAKFHSSSWKSLPDPLSAYLLPPLEEDERRRSKADYAGNKLWLNGGYTYLATRRKEYGSLSRDRYSEWSAALCNPPKGSDISIADMVACFLTPSGRPFETYIHGDVKSENLFTTDSGDQVAFFDFQYAGLGLGVCDLAKLFTCSVPLDMLTADDAIPDQLPMGEGERTLLEKYRETLLSSRPKSKKDFEYDWDTFVRHWETALVDWCRFQASWGFWGNTEWLEARVRSIMKDEDWRDWLLEESPETRRRP